MSNRISRNLDKPDETVRFENLVLEKVELGELTVGRTTVLPGWRWSKHVQPHVGGAWCKARHVGVVLSGRFGVVFSVGSKMEFGPNDAFDIPPTTTAMRSATSRACRSNGAASTFLAHPGPAPRAPWPRS